MPLTDLVKIFLGKNMASVITVAISRLKQLRSRGIFPPISRAFLRQKDHEEPVNDSDGSKYEIIKAATYHYGKTRATRATRTTLFYVVGKWSETVMKHPE
jgi:hypothetical protein